MKPFRFRLARLVRVREAEEEIARDLWQRAERRYRDAEERVERIIEEIAAAIDALRHAQGGARLSPRGVLAIQATIDRQHAALEDARRRTEQLRSLADEERKPWQALRMELGALERLEAKARATHRLEATREENKEMDQLASERAARRSAGSPFGGFVDSTRGPRRESAECR